VFSFDVIAALTKQMVSASVPHFPWMPAPQPQQQRLPAMRAAGSPLLSRAAIHRHQAEKIQAYNQN
jgi:hypothetical protein